MANDNAAAKDRKHSLFNKAVGYLETAKDSNMPTPNDGGVSKKVADAKKALATARSKFPDNPNFKPKTPAPAPAPKAPAMPKTSSYLPDENTGAGLREKARNVKEYNENLPKMHDGGEVDEDGPKNLKKGEVVIPKEKAAEGKKILALKSKAHGAMHAAKDEVDEEEKESKPAEKAHKPAPKKTADKQHAGRKPHNYARTEIVYHKNGSSTTTHHHRPPQADADGKIGQQQEPDSYGSPDHDSMMSSLDQAVGGGPMEMGGQGGGQPVGA